MQAGVQLVPDDAGRCGARLGGRRGAIRRRSDTGTGENSAQWLRPTDTSSTERQRTVTRNLAAIHQEPRSSSSPSLATTQAQTTNQRIPSPNASEHRLTWLVPNCGDSFHDARTRGSTTHDKENLDSSPPRKKREQISHDLASTPPLATTPFSSRPQPRARFLFPSRTVSYSPENGIGMMNDTAELPIPILSHTTRKAVESQSQKDGP